MQYLESRINKIKAFSFSLGKITVVEVGSFKDEVRKCSVTNTFVLRISYFLYIDIFFQKLELEFEKLE